MTESISNNNNNSNNNKTHIKMKNSKSRCTVCRKKLGLMIFDCRCEQKFCITHSRPEEHECTFDYKSYQREILKKNNPQIVRDKVLRI